jgi:hypothetical protein
VPLPTTARIWSKFYESVSAEKFVKKLVFNKIIGRKKHQQDWNSAENFNKELVLWNFWQKSIAQKIHKIGFIKFSSKNAPKRLKIEIIKLVLWSFHPKMPSKDWNLAEHFINFRP